ncbi:MAG: Putative sortase (Surface protein transpeptidase) [uncultured Nocardioides sp.]|uniref:Sortase (Surface protein transpeptidase) n=1 Tax=uncultured Nocardioides sp. TaxID=198441 RepID=A0A6J4N4L3_9ACTN|nr:MAG: Putative sortase (Surface protein transpeptidase) [uncultured Nocardioides sp.]
MDGRTRLVATVLVVTVMTATPGCATQDEGQAADPPAERTTAPLTPSGPDPTGPGATEPSPDQASPSPPVPTASPTEEATPRPPEPRRSFVSIPELGLRDVPVVRYRGSPDDGPGTAIQNTGPMASPRGPRGGVGPGEVGNFIVTGHRLSGTAPLRYAPSLRRGDRVRVRSGDTVFVYEVRRTRWTSFRSPRSLAGQRAPVPGRPGRTATRPMITLSTCATIEDHAAGNYWSDRYDNPEHRIDKIGALVATRPA